MIINFANDTLLSVDALKRRLDALNPKPFTTPTVVGSSIINILAAAIIPAFQVVTSTGFQANSSSTAHLNRVVGICQTDMNIGFISPIVESGEITNPAWTWTTGDIIFLNGTSLSTSVPGTGFVQIIGTASKANTIAVDLGPPILY